jgi:hypothetical protein
MRQRNCQLKVSSNHLDFALSMLKTQFCVSFGIGCDRNNLTDFVQIVYNVCKLNIMTRTKLRRDAPLKLRGAEGATGP